MASDLAQEALRPFAAVGSWLSLEWRDNDDTWPAALAGHDFAAAPSCPTVGDLRRARAAYDAIGSEVKALEWREPTDHPQDNEDALLVADGLGGRYSISHKQSLHNGGTGHLLWWAHDGFSFAEFHTPNQAKAAAQADFERRVLSCLSPVAVEEADAKAGGLRTLQARVGSWTLECFGDEIACDMLERMDRFTEEALELVQSLGYTPDRAHALVDYVFGREAGEPSQEVGGTMTTLAALCNVAKIDIETAFRTEVERITTPAMVQKIRAKQAAKPTGSALPVALSTHTAAGDRTRLDLGNLLAIIHRDGGQYELEHGTAKAVEEAHRIIGELLDHTATGAGPDAEEEVLPCDVMVAPRTLFRKGVKLSTMLAGLRLRASWPEVERIEPTAVPAGAGPVGEAVAWEDFVALRIKALEEGARSAKKDFAIEELAFVLKFAPRRAARPVEEPGEVERLTRERDEALEEVEKAAEDGYAEGYQEGLVEGRNGARGAYRDVFKFVYRWLDDRKLIFDEGEGINVNDVEEGLRLYQNDALAIERNRAYEAEARLARLEAAVKPIVDRVFGALASAQDVDRTAELSPFQTIQILGSAATGGATFSSRELYALRVALTGDAQEAGK